MGLIWDWNGIGMGMGIEKNWSHDDGRPLAVSYSVIHWRREGEFEWMFHHFSALSSKYIGLVFWYWFLGLLVLLVKIKSTFW